MEMFVSNFNEDVRGNLNLPKKVSVYDCTLRDGEQTPGVSFKREEKLAIARQLDKLGVDYIEAGFPMNSGPEREVVKEIAKLGLSSKVSGLCRVLKPDMDACISCDVDLVHTFVSTSDLHLKYQMGKSRPEVRKMAVDAIDYLKSHGFKVLFSPMDATRTGLPYLTEICKAVEQAGASIINVPDTVGVMHPPATRHLFSELKKQIKIPLDVHCHNDFGLAVPNSLAAVEAGAEQVQVTINGLGERAGNADLEQTVMSLHALYKVKTNIKYEYLTETSHMLEKFSDITLPPNFPIVGKNAFAHESGIHVHAVLKRAETFEPLRPEVVGQRRRIVIGKHTGRHSVKTALDVLGYSVSEKQLLEITQRIKELAEKKKRVYDEDISAIAEDVSGSERKIKERVKLDELLVTSGNKITPTASVKIIFDGSKREASSTGVGPVDAVARAIESIVGKEANLSLKEYNLKAITGGTEALADVSITVEDQHKNRFVAHATHEDIIMASVLALIQGINKALSFEKK